MEHHICDTRKAILQAAGHLLVTGGPGSGKTTIALLKAQEIIPHLEPGQEILFLSFSRDAVRQIINRCKTVLSPKERKCIEVQTYHSFCIEILRSHGMLINGMPTYFIFPAEEKLQKSGYEGDWSEEQKTLSQKGLYCFDMVASGVADLLEESDAVRRLYADKFPFIIVDEFQDTNDDQWRVVQALSKNARVFCLADPEQRIFEYDPKVDPERVNKLKQAISLEEFDLGGENHRSPAGGILQFADAILNNTAPLPTTPDVKLANYYANSFETMTHASVVWTFSELRRRGIDNPCVAVLCRSNPMVAKVSLILAEKRPYKKKAILPVIAHDVLWDADLAAAAALVLASILEWPNLTPELAVSGTLEQIIQYYRLKRAEKPTAAAENAENKYIKATEALREGKTMRSKAPKELLEAAKSGLSLQGNAVSDWKEARKILDNIDDFSEIAKQARMVRLFRATDVLASGLSTLWLDNGSYKGAPTTVKSILDQERLIAGEKAPSGCILMNIHKSKGKEFDGVVLIEGQFASQFYDTNNEDSPYPKSRRLLRVGITRAKSLVTILRPHGAPNLVG